MKHLIVPILTLLFATSLYSQDAERTATLTRISKQSATETGDRGSFTVPSAETLNKGQFSTGFGWNNVDRAPRDLDISSLPLFFSFGAHGRLTVTGSFETRRQIVARNLSQTGFNDQYPFVATHFTEGFGDTTLAAKYRFRRRPDNVGGLSFRGFVKLPTADETRGLGTGTTDVGADVIFSSLLPLNFMMHSAIGYTYTTKVTDPVSNAKGHIKDQLRSGIAVLFPASGIHMGGRLQFVGEYNTITNVGAGTNNAAEAVVNPSDIVGGLRYLLLNSGLTLNAGYRRNMKIDSTLPGKKDTAGFIFSVSFTNPVQPPGRNRFPVLSLETAPEEIRVGEFTTITATGFDSDNDPLTYSWTTTGGRVAGSGEKVTFSGGAPGIYTIRGTVSDGKGGTATSLIDVTVK